jgi:hypothetical protein
MEKLETQPHSSSKPTHHLLLCALIRNKRFPRAILALHQPILVLHRRNTRCALCNERAEELPMPLSIPYSINAIKLRKIKT